MFIDIGVAVVILICFIVGIKRGFLKTLLSICVIVGGLFLTAWLTGLLVGWIKSANPDIYSKFLEFCVGNTLSLRQLFSSVKVLDYENSVTLKGLYTPMLAVMDNIVVFKDGAAASAGDVMTVLVSLHTGMLIIMLIIYFAVTIVLEIIASIIKAIARGKKDRKPRGFSRFVGSLLGIVNGALICVILLMVGTAVVPVPALTAPMTSQTDTSFTYKYVMTEINNVTESKIITNDLVFDAFKQAGYKVEATVSGTITDGAQPIEGAVVTYTSESGRVRSTVTDAEGKYSLNVALGSNTVTVEKEGYRLPYSGDPRVEGDSTYDYILIQNVPAVISGTVTDGSTAIANACVTVEDESGKQYVAYTDAEGKYTVEAVTGMMKYTVTKSGYETATARELVIVVQTKDFTLTIVSAE